jgi:hypothetical protein
METVEIELNLTGEDVSSYLLEPITDLDRNEMAEERLQTQQDFIAELRVYSFN